MQLTRSINVVTLACLLFLTGCFGVTDDTITPEADGEATTSINHAPAIQTSTLLNQYGMLNAEMNSTFDNISQIETVHGFELELFHAVVDIDGDTMTIGWDIDLDGMIDISANESSGFTHVYVPFEYWTGDLYAFDDSGYLEDQGWDEDTFYAPVAFIAVDQNGLGDAVIVELVVQRTHYRQTVFYDFAADGAIEGEPSTATDDSLVRITMNQGQEINWAAISVKISIDDGAPLTCDKDSGDGSCSFVEFGTTDDQVWGVGDGIT
ncbi:MAG: hypothetical protein L7U62_06760, partial [Candidatus Poseidoniaceae archaeon]|nr:hypothetical protein [Candidatus Poseidoniaceae archaeon]